MGQQQSKAATTADSSEEPASRLYYLDNFRTFLTGVVIYHHTAIPYGGAGNDLYKSSLHGPGSSAALVGFNLVNQSYFMGSFFFLSGYFSSRTLRRKGRRDFLKTKILKLGTPVVVYTLLGTPTIVSCMRLWKGQPLDWSILTSYWKTLRGVRGHVWYAATLLLFDTLATMRPYQHTVHTEREIISNLALNIASSFLIRLAYPVGTFLEPLRLQPAFLPQYISAYRLGATLNSAPSPYLSPRMRRGLAAASVASAAIGVGLLSYKPGTYTLNSIWGGPNLAALSYSVWNETTGYLLGTAELQIFRDSNLLNRSWGGVGKYSYAAFLVHMIVVSVVQMVCDGWAASGVVKTAVVGTVSLVGSWAVGWGLVKLPFIGQVVG